MRLTVTPLALLGIAVLAGCSDTAAPDSGNELALARSAAAAAAPAEGLTGRHIIQLSRQPAADFAQAVEALGGRVEWSAAGLATVSGLDAAGRDKLSRRKEVTRVYDDIAIERDAPQADFVLEGAGTTEPQSQAAPNTSFFYPRQWHLRAVGADQAWAAGHLGSSSVSVFILDTGIDYLHFDLLGLVDLARSADMLGKFNVRVNNVVVEFSEADTIAKYLPGRHTISDLFFHGTHVASTVSSRSFVSAGVTSMTRLVGVKVCAYLNTCPLSSVLEGVIYAADNGADVMNLSLGGGFSKAGNGQFVGLINSVFTYAGSKGTTIVVAAGNDTTDIDHNGNTYSTYCDNPAVICVAATGPTGAAGVNGPWANIDAPTAYTNFGRSAIDIAAPGGTNAAPVWAACTQTSAYLALAACAGGPTFTVGATGTSMASPHVAGAAALLVAQIGRNPAQVRARLLQSADDLGQSGTDPYYGKGRLNIARALGVTP